MVHPTRDPAALAELTLAHLQRVVAIDSQSDEASSSIPTTEGQRVLADELAAFYARLGARVERDANANVLAWFAGVGEHAGAPPVALLVHLDTARGTAAVPGLHVNPGWDGRRLALPANPGLEVSTANYPSLATWLGEDIVHGEGDRPFGLDDKLGLAHLMTLATLIAEHPEVSRPPLVFVGRPDEEVGRHEAVVGLAATFAARGVTRGYTIDGILPYEINVENFNAAGAWVRFPSRPFSAPGRPFRATVNGVNTHGATAAAEGHRAAPRLVAEWRAALPASDAIFVGFVSDALRDCDAVVDLLVPPGAEERVRTALANVMAPHLARGASWTLEEGPAVAGDTGVEAMLAWLQAFYASSPGFTLACEESAGRDGYTHPYRARPGPEGLTLDLRVRDFEVDGLAARLAHIRSLAGALPNGAHEQYVNMGPRLKAWPRLVEDARAAAADVGVEALVFPIRGGTGVDPFLDVGIPIANLGTGYFAPESEKELTSLQKMEIGRAHV